MKLTIHQTDTVLLAQIKNHNQINKSLLENDVHMTKKKTPTELTIYFAHMTILQLKKVAKKKKKIYSHFQTCPQDRGWVGMTLQGSTTQSDKGCLCHELYQPDSSSQLDTPHRLTGLLCCRSNQVGTWSRKWIYHNGFQRALQLCIQVDSWGSCCCPQGSTRGTRRG